MLVLQLECKTTYAIEADYSLRLRLAFFHSVSCVLHLRYVRRNARRQENVRRNGEC